MSNIDPKILSKIRKCLALSSSSNPNEAATALRQAHALMQKHGVSSHEITMADVGESVSESKTMARDKPAHWETGLASIVGKAFGCQIMIRRVVLTKNMGPKNDGQYVFVGLRQQAEMAAYTATVLIRKCKNARQQWLKEHFNIQAVGIKGLKAKKTRMADMFAEGWVNAIREHVNDFANPPEVDAAISNHIATKATGGEAPVRQVSSKDIGRYERMAASMGMAAAKGERLYRPMETGDAPLALGLV